jgi:hypothetical protein
VPHLVVVDASGIAGPMAGKGTVISETVSLLDSKIGINGYIPHFADSWLITQDTMVGASK